MLFSNMDVVLPKDLFSDYLEITTTVIVPCDGLKKSPCTSMMFVFVFFLFCFFVFTFSGALGLKGSTLLFGNSVLSNSELGGGA